MKKQGLARVLTSPTSSTSPTSRRRVNLEGRYGLQMAAVVPTGVNWCQLVSTGNWQLATGNWSGATCPARTRQAASAPATGRAVGTGVWTVGCRVAVASSFPIALIILTILPSYHPTMLRFLTILIILVISPLPCLSCSSRRQPPGPAVTMNYALPITAVIKWKNGPTGSVGPG